MGTIPGHVCLVAAVAGFGAVLNGEAWSSMASGQRPNTYPRSQWKKVDLQLSSALHESTAQHENSTMWCPLAFGSVLGLMLAFVLGSPVPALAESVSDNMRILKGEAGAARVEVESLKRQLEELDKVGNSSGDSPTPSQDFFRWFFNKSPKDVSARAQATPPQAATPLQAQEGMETDSLFTKFQKIFTQGSLDEPQKRQPERPRRLQGRRIKPVSQPAPMTSESFAAQSAFDAAPAFVLLGGGGVVVAVAGAASDAAKKEAEQARLARLAKQQEENQKSTSLAGAVLLAAAVVGSGVISSEPNSDVIKSAPPPAPVVSTASPTPSAEKVAAEKAAAEKAAAEKAAADRAAAEKQAAAKAAAEKAAAEKAAAEKAAAEKAAAEKKVAAEKSAADKAAAQKAAADKAAEEKAASDQTLLAGGAAAVVLGGAIFANMIGGSSESDGESATSQSPSKAADGAAGSSPKTEEGDTAEKSKDGEDDVDSKDETSKASKDDAKGAPAAKDGDSK